MSVRRAVREKAEGLTCQVNASRPELIPSSSSFLPRQLVTLAFLSESLPAALITEQLATSLCGEISAPVVVVRLAPQDGSVLTDASLNGEFHMPVEIHKTPGGYHLLTIGIEMQPSSPAAVESLLEQLGRHFRHVLIEVQHEGRTAAWLPEFLVRSELTFLFLPPAAEAACRVQAIAGLARSELVLDCLKPIICLRPDESAGDLDVVLQPAAKPAHRFLRGCPPLGASVAPRAFVADARRLAREVAGRLVGLALSSGAAKGFAHIGVIQVLEENHIEVDVIAGSSMGAYIGSLWAYGLTGVELEKLAREMESRWALWSLIDPVFPPRQGFLRGYAVKRRLMRTIGASHFSDLARPFRVVAGDLQTLERKVFSCGEVAAAVHASIAVPGICVPVQINGNYYIDGGIVDPLPVDVLREMGVTRVIAVDAIPTPERIRRGQLDSVETRRRRFFRKILPVNQQLNFFARGNLFEILMRSVQGAQIRMAESSCLLADVVLRPDIYDDRWLDCAHPGGFIALGRKVAEQHLNELCALVEIKQGLHEGESTGEAMAATA